MALTRASCCGTPRHATPRVLFYVLHEQHKRASLRQRHVRRRLQVISRTASPSRLRGRGRTCSSNYPFDRTSAGTRRWLRRRGATRCARARSTAAATTAGAGERPARVGAPLELETGGLLYQLNVGFKALCCTVRWNKMTQCFLILYVNVLLIGR